MKLAGGRRLLMEASAAAADIRDRGRGFPDRAVSVRAGGHGFRAHVPLLRLHHQHRCLSLLVICEICHQKTQSKVTFPAGYSQRTQTPFLFWETSSRLRLGQLTLTRTTLICNPQTPADLSRQKNQSVYRSSSRAGIPACAPSHEQKLTVCNMTTFSNVFIIGRIRLAE